MLVGVAAAARHLLDAQIGRLQHMAGGLHALADQDVDEGLPGVFLDAGAQVVGAHVQHGAERHKREVGFPIMLVDGLQRAGAQGLTAAHRGHQVADKAHAALGGVGLAQRLHRFAVGAVQARKVRRHVADADAALAAEHARGHLDDLIGQDVQVFLKIGPVAQQHGHDPPAGEKADAAQVLGRQLVHRGGKGGRRAARAARLLQRRGHHGVVRFVGGVLQQAALDRILRGGGVRVGEFVQHQRHQEHRAPVLRVGRAGAVRLLRSLAEQRELCVDLLVHGAQLGRQALDGQRLEHVADDVVLDGLLGVLKVVVAAQKRDVHGRADLPHLARQLNAGDERHADIGQKQVRFFLFHKLQRIQPVAGAAHQGKAELGPGHHPAHRLAQHVLVVGHHHGVDVFACPSHKRLPLPRPPAALLPPIILYPARLFNPPRPRQSKAPFFP